jgi:hypothetical protein
MEGPETFIWSELEAIGGPPLIPGGTLLLKGITTVAF